MISWEADHDLRGAGRGLGNQMFIYAFARALGLRCGEGVTLLDRQDWRDGAPAHTVCALDALNISPDVKIIADAGFAKAHLPRRNAAKALMIKDTSSAAACWPATGTALRLPLPRC